MHKCNWQQNVSKILHVIIFSLHKTGEICHVCCKFNLVSSVILSAFFFFFFFFCNKLTFLVLLVKIFKGKALIKKWENPSYIFVLARISCIFSIINSKLRFVCRLKYFWPKIVVVVVVFFFLFSQKIVIFSKFLCQKRILWFISILEMYRWGDM